MKALLHVDQTGSLTSHAESSPSQFCTNDQVWLTSALTDSDVPNALTLCFSLRRVLTPRRLGVIVSPKVSRGLREALNYGFDFVFTLEEDRNTAGLEAEDFVKLFALTFKCFDKCVMLSPNMLVVKNCDELLDGADDADTEQEAPQPFAWTKDGDLSILALRPSLPTFNCLIKALAKRNGTGLDTFLRTWLINQTPKYNFLDEKYNRGLFSGSKMLMGNEHEISIVNLINKPDGDWNVGKLGLIGERIMNLWKNIHDESVLPLLEAMKTHIYPEIENDGGFNNDAVAIVGMACRYPGSNNLKEFWQILLEGKDATGNPPEFRWLKEQCSQPCKPEHRKTNAGFLKCAVDDFDFKFFNISPKEMVCLDPQHRLLHELVWEGLEDAAINPHSLEGTNGGVFIGSWLNEYKDILTHAGHDEFYRMYMGNSIGAGAARISHLLGLTGPAISTESGCSSAMVAVHLACKSLQRRETNMALACGVNLILHPFDHDIMPMVIAPDGHCKTFDAKADGFARGEGCGVLVLKRLSDAIRDQDKIWALVGGSGMTQEGVSKSMGTPTVHCESKAMKQALRDAGVLPSQVSYVEAHGTGTVVGDPMEVSAIAKAYHSKQRKEPLLIGSVKTNVGHTESCSGITGIMKVVLAMQNEIIPPHRNFETPNPAIDLDAVPAKIPLEPVNWPKQKGIPRLAGVSSFGITGTDAHAIIEEAPTIPAAALTIEKFERPLHIMKISSKTDEAMDILLDSYKNHLSTSNNDLADLAFTANVGRAEFTQRAVIIAKSKEDAIKNIDQNKILKGEESLETIGKVCFLFTGQGSQYPGMAKNLYETSPVFRMHFEYCQKILKNNYNIDITQVLWSNDKSAEVSRTIYSQTSIFCVEYALLKLWESWGVKPDYALGHSLGEFAAAVCTGMLTVEDAIKLVAERSRMIDNLPRGKMLVIKADKQQVDTLMKKFAGNDKNKILDYAAVNAPDQTVVAGDSDVVLQFSESCKKSNLKNIVLDATHAFHSKHMDPMLAAYGKVAKTVQKLPGNDCKYISGMKGTVLETNQVNPQYWVSHTREKVLFMDASKKAVELGCKTFIEIGPQPILSALTMMNNDTQLLCLPSLKRNETEWETLLNTLGKLHLKGLGIDWKSFDQFYNRKKVSLPHYPFIGKKYWTEMLSVTGSSIHPLVGCVIPNASSTKIFQNGLNIRDMEYVKDHAIGDHVIFPGAGYLEMCLAAGLATVEGSTEALSTPTRAMKVENLSIQAPLSLDESKTAQVQTVVDLNMSSENDGDWNDMKISISRKMESDSTKWLPHAKAIFSPLPTTEEKSISFDSDAFTQTLNKPSNDDFIQEIYDKLASVGLKFGPNFRSLEKIWRDEENRSLLAKVKVPSGEGSSHSNHIIHPVVLDAMIQAIMMLRLTSNLKKKLYVPIQIGKFIWLSSPSENSTDIFVHSFEAKDSSSSDTALLLDSTGKVLASMFSVEFIDTTVKAIDSVLAHQTSSMPDLWDEVWKPQLGPLEHRLDLLKAKESCSSLKIDSDNYNIPSPPLASLFREVESLVYYNMLRCLYTCGWEPRLHQTFDEDTLHKQLKIEGSHRQYFGFMLEVLRIEGFLTKESDIKWKVTKLPPTLQETEAILSSPRFTTELTSNYNTTPLFTKVGENLSKIMTGGVAALNILFPEVNDGYPSVGDFYMTYERVFQIKECIVSKCTQKMSNIRQSVGGNKTILRFLEIGAGTGSFTENALDALADTGTEFEYTYTDISAAFFPAAEKKFEKYAKFMKFRKLNIEEDPMDQGFTPEYYDHVCASDVIHATRDIKESLRNMRRLMKPQAMLELQEMTGPHRFVFFLFGLLEGFWRFEDKELRQKYCTLTGPQWRSVLKSSGFEVENLFPMVNNYHSYFWARRTETPERMEILEEKNKKSWLLFTTDEDMSRKVSSYIEERLGATTTRRAIYVRAGSRYQLKTEQTGELTFTIRKDVEEDFVALIEHFKTRQINLEGIVYSWAMEGKIGEGSQEDILRPYFYLTKSLLTTGLSSPRIVVVTTGALPVGDSDMSNFRASTLMGFTKSLKNENHVMNLRVVDVEPALGYTQLEEIYSELWSTDKDVALAYRGGTRFVAKLQAHKVTSSALSLPKGTDRFELVLPETKVISDLVFGPLDTTNLGENEVEIQVKASALNFRDVLSVIKPTEQFKNINAVGFDLAGVVKKVGEKVTKWKVGDVICGCNTHFTALPSHVNLHEDLLFEKPAHISVCDAATMPAVYMTSVLCLVDVAKIKKEDVVLIHTASGGVGLSAIEICKSVGCAIIATAGSKRKQTYLRSIGIQHILHSRNTQYGDQILELTNGRGVDVVLNSLTSEGFKEATLKACAKGARFVEMSKLNIWEEAEVRELRPDVEYTVVDLSAAKQDEMKVLHGKLRKLLADGIMKPVPNVRFDALNIREALQYMQKAKHIGKVVCVMPEFKQEDGKMKVYTPMFNDSCTYLITGGLGGIGFEVCKWMIEKGAKHIILASRRPPSHSIQNKINEMNSKGANIIPVSLDVGNFDECKNLFQSIGEMKLPPLKGVMHAAGIIADALIQNMDWTKLSSTFSTKVNGTLNLHELTKSLDLEHFVVFSSMAALFGPPGQCNHAAGNAFEDALIQFRNSIGLPGTTVNWGQWGEVGIATEVDLPGVKTLSNLQGLTGLEYTLKAQHTQLAILQVESFRLLSKLFPQLAVFLDESIWKSANVATVTVRSEEFWENYDSKSEAEEKVGVIKKQLKSILKTVLKLDESEDINEDGNFQEMGVDSLMFVEIKNGLQALLGTRVTINASALKDCRTINQLAETMFKLIEGESTDESLPPTPEAVKELLRKDSVLPERITAANCQREAVKVRDIKRVFLAGATGTLGPYMLKALANSPQISEVVCLMRASKNETEEERLRRFLSTREMLTEVDMKKVRCVSGNVVEPNLGLETEVWEELTNSVDAIFNCSARVQHNEQYRKRNSKTDVRAVNIEGTKNLLQFACEKKLKHFYQASSLLAVVTTDELGRVSETWPNLGDYDELTTFAYPISKYVGDVLTKEAVARGIPCKAFRFPLITGDSKTGRCAPENNHGLLRYMFIMKHGMMPSTPFPLPILPVDVCAEVSLKIFFNEKAPSDVYNVGNAKVDVEQEFVKVAKKFGYDVSIVELSEFLQKVKESAERDPNSALSLFSEMYSDEDALMSTYTSAPVIQRWIEGNEGIYMSGKLPVLVPDFYETQRNTMDYIYKDLLFVKGKGWFGKFGL